MSLSPIWIQMKSLEERRIGLETQGCGEGKVGLALRRQEGTGKESFTLRLFLFNHWIYDKGSVPDFPLSSRDSVLRPLFASSLAHGLPPAGEDLLCHPSSPTPPILERTLWEALIISDTLWSFYSCPECFFSLLSKGFQLS